MVVIGVVYQIHLDRRSKRKKKQYQYHYTGSGECPLVVLTPPESTLTS